MYTALPRLAVGQRARVACKVKLSLSPVAAQEILSTWGSCVGSPWDNWVLTPSANSSAPAHLDEGPSHYTGCDTPCRGLCMQPAGQCLPCALPACASRIKRRWPASFAMTLRPLPGERSRLLCLQEASLAQLPSGRVHSRRGDHGAVAAPDRLVAGALRHRALALAGSSLPLMCYDAVLVPCYH